MAKTLYVDSVIGNDATTYANCSKTNPWRSIDRAVWGSTSYASQNASQAAQAGDVVFVASGTYWANGSTTLDSESKWRVALNPVNSGTQNNEICFVGVGNVYIRLNANIRGPMIGAFNRNYIIWKNFIIDDYYGGSASDFGPVAFAANSNFCQLLNCEVIGHAGSYYHGYATFEGNYRLVGLEDAHDCLIKNNRIRQARNTDNTVGTQNCGGILTYDCNRNIYENNTFDDCGVAIFVKGVHAPETQVNTIIRNNYIDNCRYGIRVISGDDTSIYQNIITNAQGADGTGIWIGFGDALRSKWINNTIVNCPRGIVLQDDGLAGGLSQVELHNNLISDCDYAIYNWSAGSLNDVDASFTRNFYYNNTTHFSGEGIGTINFATWQGTYSKDVNGINGTNPSYTDAANANYRITNSTALTTGRAIYSVGGTTGNTIPVGSYISGTEFIGIVVTNFDSSEYRKFTYGVPTHYCDCTRSLSSNGAGTLANAWNLMQASVLCAPGNIIGFLPVGANTPAALPAPTSVHIPAFDPRDSGTSDTNRIIFVTKHAAVALSDVANNSLRSELRHSGTRAVSNGTGETGTGGALYGSYFRNYLTYDGFFTNMEFAQPAEDSGVIRTEYATGVHFKNFEIKGTTTNIFSNPILYRPQGVSGTILSNFRAYDFVNDQTGTLGQEALFSDQYGDENFLIEHFEIRNIENGLFLKGSALGSYTMRCYGTIQYGIVQDSQSCYQINDCHPNSANITTVRYCVAHGVPGYSNNDRGAFSFSQETNPAVNILVHNITLANIQAISGASGFYAGSQGFGTAPNNVIVRDSLVDMDSGASGELLSYGGVNSVPQTQDYNAYYKNGSSFTGSFNNVGGLSFAAWKAATGKETNGIFLTSSPFVDRANNNYRIVNGHQAKTSSSTGGEVGAYATTEIIGVDVGVYAYAPLSGGSGPDVTPPAIPTGFYLF